ncbi:hypothetical protein CN918_28180 [Priestia megaterium]|nr:hypothetical protein CN918_28180 [Priestia megaterium]
MKVKSIDVFIDEPNANELELILSIDKLDYESLNQKLEYYILEYDSLLESRSILFSDQCVMTIIVYIEEDKAHIYHWLTTPAGEEIQGNKHENFISTYYIEHNHKRYSVRLICRD